ncbi:dynein light chain 4, axonemal [Agrilus planipennis]|uniref:Dynein light chain n=1 Tax=Agrilus planipennis TaxID=224129 RepID=A0A1W4W362_AGRPL|nr:dynein light chain 4, axonemal [Agrilus planipennis]
MAEEEQQPVVQETTKKTTHTYPLLRKSDMSEEAIQETMDLVVTACEKFAANNELAARMIKETMDKKYGPPFNVVVGEGYGFQITYETKNLLYMFFGGNLAILAWKC